MTTGQEAELEVKEMTDVEVLFGTSDRQHTLNVVEMQSERPD